MKFFFQIFILACDWFIALGFASGTYVINRHFVQRHEVAETFFVYNEYTTLCFPNLRLDDHYMIFQTCLSGMYILIWPGGGKALTMTMTPWNLPHGQWSKKLTMTMKPSFCPWSMVKIDQFWPFDHGNS